MRKPRDMMFTVHLTTEPIDNPTSAYDKNIYTVFCDRCGVSWVSEGNGWDMAGQMRRHRTSTNGCMHIK